MATIGTSDLFMTEPGVSIILPQAEERFNETIESRIDEMRVDEVKMFESFMESIERSIPDKITSDQVVDGSQPPPQEGDIIEINIEGELEICISKKTAEALRNHLNDILGSHNPHKGYEISYTREPIMDWDRPMREVVEEPPRERRPGMGFTTTTNDNIRVDTGTGDVWQRIGIRYAEGSE